MQKKTRPREAKAELTPARAMLRIASSGLGEGGAGRGKGGFRTGSWTTPRPNRTAGPVPGGLPRSGGSSGGPSREPSRTDQIDPRVARSCTGGRRTRPGAGRRGKRRRGRLPGQRWWAESRPIEAIPALRAPSSPAGASSTNHALAGGQRKPTCRFEEDGRVGLAPSHLVRGDDGVEESAEADDLEHRVDVRPGSGRSEGLLPAGLSQASPATRERRAGARRPASAAGAYRPASFVSLTRSIHSGAR